MVLHRRLLHSCCPDSAYSADLWFTEENFDSGCNASIVLDAPFQGTSGFYLWDVPDSTCFDGNTDIRIFGRFRCAASGLEVAYGVSETFTVSP